MRSAPTDRCFAASIARPRPRRLGRRAVRDGARRGRPAALGGLLELRIRMQPALELCNRLPPPRARQFRKAKPAQCGAARRDRRGRARCSARCSRCRARPTARPPTTAATAAAASAAPGRRSRTCRSTQCGHASPPRARGASPRGALRSRAATATSRVGQLAASRVFESVRLGPWDGSTPLSGSRPRAARARARGRRADRPRSPASDDEGRRARREDGGSRSSSGRTTTPDTANAQLSSRGVSPGTAAAERARRAAAAAARGLNDVIAHERRGRGRRGRGNGARGRAKAQEERARGRRPARDQGAEDQVVVTEAPGVLLSGAARRQRRGAPRITDELNKRLSLAAAAHAIGTTARFPASATAGAGAGTVLYGL